MKYDEVYTLMDDSEAIRLVSQSGRDAKDVLKNIIDKIDDIKSWNRCHIEYGVLQNVERTDYDSGNYAIKVTFDTGKVQQDGSTLKTGRFKFQPSNSPLFTNLNNAVGKRCKFYVSYTRGTGNKEGEAYRQVLDWQAFGDAAPVMQGQMQPQQVQGQMPVNPANANFQFN